MLFQVNEYIQTGVLESPIWSANEINADFGIELGYFFVPNTQNPKPSTGPNAKVITRYWDPAKLRPRNRIVKIEGFLFANQFVFYPFDTPVDRGLRINGGIAAKDFAGRLTNAAGPMQANPDVAPFQASSATSQLQVNNTDPSLNSTLGSLTPDPASGTTVPIQSQPFAGATSLPGVILTLDPRAQFNLDLINEDVGKVDSVN